MSSLQGSDVFLGLWSAMWLAWAALEIRKFIKAGRPASARPRYMGGPLDGRTVTVKTLVEIGATPADRLLVCIDGQPVGLYQDFTGDGTLYYIGAVPD